MKSYRVICYEPDCGREARYKIAARWSDGLTQELKTYSLCCAECLSRHFAASLLRHDATGKLAFEHSERPGIYELTPGQRDRALVRLEDKEREFAG